MQDEIVCVIPIYIYIYVLCMKTKLLVVVCIVGCFVLARHLLRQNAIEQSNKLEKSVQLNSPFLKDTSEVKASVDTIYTTLCDTYNGALDEDQQSEMSLDRRFCTKAWNKTMEDCERERMKRHEQMGCFDYDYWIGAQDWDVLSYKIEGISMNFGSSAQVFLKLKNGKKFSTFMLMMKKEGGRWLIDDIISDSEGDKSVMQCAREYLKE